MEQNIVYITFLKLVALGVLKIRRRKSMLKKPKKIKMKYGIPIEFVHTNIIKHDSDVNTMFDKCEAFRKQELNELANIKKIAHALYKEYVKKFKLPNTMFVNLPEDTQETFLEPAQAVSKYIKKKV